MTGKHVTVYQMMQAGKTMDETRIQIRDILNVSGLSCLDAISLLDLMVFDLKWRRGYIP